MSDNAKKLSLGDVIKLEITEINNLGAGIGKLDGLVVFVKGGVSGDVVEAKIIKLEKSFAVARLCFVVPTQGLASPSLLLAKLFLCCAMLISAVPTLYWALRCSALAPPRIAFA